MQSGWGPSTPTAVRRGQVRPNAVAWRCLALSCATSAPQVGRFQRVGYPRQVTLIYKIRGLQRHGAEHLTTR